MRHPPRTITQPRPRVCRTQDGPRPRRRIARLTCGAVTLSEPDNGSASSRSIPHKKEVEVTVNDQDPYSVNHTDSDPEETAEWRESLDTLVAAEGPARAREIMLSLLKRSKE